MLNSKFGRPTRALLIFVLLVLSLTLAGCLPTRGAGWSGVVVAEDMLLYVDATQGKLVARKLSDQSLEWPPWDPEIQQGGGFLSCGAAPVKIGSYGSPAASGDLVYLGTNIGKVYAVSLEKGTLRWEYPQTEAMAAIIGSPALSKIETVTKKASELALSEGDLGLGWSLVTQSTEESEPATSAHFVHFEGAPLGQPLWLKNWTLVYENVADAAAAYEAHRAATTASTELTIGNQSFWSLDNSAARLEFRKQNVVIIFHYGPHLVTTEPSLLIGVAEQVEKRIFQPGSLLVGADDGGLYAIDALSGVKKWSYPTGDKIWSTSAVSGDVAYFGSFDHKLYALDVDTGRLVWTFEAGGAIACTPLVVKGVVYFGSFDGKLYAVDAQNGQPVWPEPFQAENWFWADPLHHDGVIYAASIDHRVYALDAETGSEKQASFNAGGPIRSSPVLVNGVLVVGTTDGRVFGLDPETWDYVWSQRNLGAEIRGPLYAAENLVFLSTADSKLYTLNAADGSDAWPPISLGQ